MTPTRETFGNISTVSQVMFYLVAAASMAVFAYGICADFDCGDKVRPAIFDSCFPDECQKSLAS